MVIPFRWLERDERARSRKGRLIRSFLLFGDGAKCVQEGPMDRSFPWFDEQRSRSRKGRLIRSFLLFGDGAKYVREPLMDRSFP